MGTHLGVLRANARRAGCCSALIKQPSIPFLEQLNIVRGADVIVAPHGMGLTYIAFHERQPLLIELHNPTIGTDAYAFVAHALGFKYHAIFGTDLGGDTRHFNILPRDVTDVLSREEILPMSAAECNSLPPIETKLLAGVQSGGITEVLDVSPLKSGSPVYRHVRDEVAVQPDNNCGWLEATGLVKGVVYHCACEVWLPSASKCDTLTVAWSGLAYRGSPHIDLSRRDQWQTIGIDGAATEELVNFVLRCDADAGGVFYSRGWRFGSGADAG